MNEMQPRNAEEAINNAKLMKYYAHQFCTFKYSSIKNLLL